MPKGEKILAQSKRTAPPPFEKFYISNWYVDFQLVSYDRNFFNMIFSIGIFKEGIPKLVPKYKFQLVSIKPS
jgi:hypothetical protein